MITESKQNKTWVYTESPILSDRIQKGEHNMLHISTKISSYTSLMLEIDKIKHKIPIGMKAIIIFGSSPGSTFFFIKIRSLKKCITF